MMTAMRGALPSIGRAAPIRLATDVWILVLVSEVEAEVVDHISNILDDVGALVEVASGSTAAQVLKRGQVVMVGGGRKAGEDALVGEEVRASTDGEEGPLADGIFFLQFREGRNDTKRLGILLNDCVGVPAEDDKDVVVLQLLVSLLVRDLAGKGDVLATEDSLLGTGDRAIEGLGLYTELPCQHWMVHVAH